MYEDNKININWFKIGLRLVIILLIILLSIKLITIILDNKSVEIKADVMQERINTLYETGKTYLNDNLPLTSGEKNEVSLKTLVENNLIVSIVDDNNEECSLEESYVRVTKLDNEYQYKTYLKCNNYENDYIDYISISNDEETTEEHEETTTTTTTTTTVVTTTKKVTTTVTKKYTISFNTNGGNLIDDIKVVENNKVNNLPTPIREGYTFVGWYYHGNVFDTSTNINQNYVLTAKWSKN